MDIFEIEWPGSSVVDQDLNDEQRALAYNLLHLMQHELTNATIALHLFTRARQDLSAVVTTPTAWNADHAQRTRDQGSAEQLLAQQHPHGFNEWSEQFEAKETLVEQIRRDRLRQQWAAGMWPDDLIHQAPALHARSFVIALDTLAQASRQLRNRGLRTAIIQALRDTWDSKVPDLKAVRDSISHADERSMSRAGRKPLDLKPVDTESVKAPGGGLLIRESLRGPTYSFTTDDGSVASVDIAFPTAEAARDLLQGCVRAFKWTGPVTTTPQR